MYKDLTGQIQIYVRKDQIGEKNLLITFGKQRI